MTRAKLLNKVRSSYAVLLLAALAGCGGGAPTTETPVTNGPTAGPNYVGPPPATADIQAFKLNFWDNLEANDRCGSCHKPSQSPRFVRADDINLAYQDTNSSGIVDLTNPGVSRIVAKVRSGHHCWLADNNACGDTLVRWITAWASITQSGGSRGIQLTPPVMADPGPARVFPATANDGGAASFANTVYPLLTANCAGCHRANALVPQQPFFASSDVNVAFEQAKTKMNLDLPAQSRLVLRLRNEFHNCWAISGATADCPGSATRMENAITLFAGGIPATPIPPAWLTSKALGLYGGTIASGGSRYETNQIALYEFKTGEGFTVFDTSGVSPALNLTLSGGYSWVGGWGVQFTGGKAQGQFTPSGKIAQLAGATGEFSIEAWAAPANVAQTGSRIVSYSGGETSRNFNLGQTVYNYDFFTRTTTSGANGVQLSTPDAARALQASLQHVVVTFDPVNGRRIYVNGVFTGTQAPGGQSIGASWDNTFALVLGNEVNGAKPWLGTLKLVAIHNRALTAPQVAQNFAAGVGEKYLLLFSVSHLVNMPQAYVMFEVSQYDSYAYLFSYPKLISLDPAALPGNIVVKGMRIGINGSEPIVGQAYRPLDTIITDAMYSVEAGASLSNVGTIISLERGPTLDEFFLTFEQLGTNMNARTEPTPLAPQPHADVARPSDIGIKTFDGINLSFAQITGVSVEGTSGAAGRMRTTYEGLKQALPTVPSFGGFLAAHQISVAQLAIAYCSEMVNDSALRTAFFGNVNVNSPLTSQGDRDAIINPVLDRVFGNNLNSQPDKATAANELNLLIDNSAAGRAQGLCRASACGGARTLVVMKAVCGAGLASGAALIE